MRLVGDLTVKQWIEIKERFENSCAACGSEERLSLDHIVPIILGGEHTASNVQPLCMRCNCSKGKKIIDYRESGMLRICGKELLDPHHAQSADATTTARSTKSAGSCAAPVPSHRSQALLATVA